MKSRKLSGFGFAKRQRSLRGLRFPPALPTRPSGPAGEGAAALGPETGPVFQGGSFGSVPGRSGGTPAIVRGRRALSGAIRPVPETGLPCISWFSEGRCRSSFDPHLSGEDGFPSPCREADRSGTARFPRGIARRSHRPRKVPARAPTRSGKLPARGGIGGLEKTAGAPSAADCSDGIPRDPARAPGRFWTIPLKAPPSREDAGIGCRKGGLEG